MANLLLEHAVNWHFKILVLLIYFVFRASREFRSGKFLIYPESEEIPSVKCTTQLRHL